MTCRFLATTAVTTALTLIGLGARAEVKPSNELVKVTAIAYCFIEYGYPEIGNHYIKVVASQFTKKQVRTIMSALDFENKVGQIIDRYGGCEALNNNCWKSNACRERFKQLYPGERPYSSKTDR